MSTAAIYTPRASRKHIVVAIYAAIVAFLAYASVYAYRKPFTIVTFGDKQYWNISYQSLLIISQVIGYTLSKFYGIRFIAGLKRVARWKSLLFFLGIAWFSLFLFAITPSPYGILLFLVNGFVLGFIWGIVFSYVEGRRATDFIGATMAVSFIFAGGFTRSVAKWLMLDWGISEQWMPFMTGLVFAIPLAIFIYLLEKIPSPDEEDVRERTIRLPMNRTNRKFFLQLFSHGIIIITITYVFLTVMRDIRDNYMGNLWNELGYGNNYSIFAQTETKTSLIILIIMGLLVLVRKNISALRIVHWVIVAGFLLTLSSSWLFINEKISGVLWMQLTGLGLYMGYIPFNCIFFERLIAASRIPGNSGFLIYIADAYGYLGSVVVILSKEFLNLEFNWTEFYSHGVLIVSLIGIAGTITSFIYFDKKFRSQYS